MQQGQQNQQNYQNQSNNNIVTDQNYSMPQSSQQNMQSQQFPQQQLHGIQNQQFYPDRFQNNYGGSNQQNQYPSSQNQNMNYQSHNNSYQQPLSQSFVDNNQPQTQEMKPRSRNSRSSMNLQNHANSMLSEKQLKQKLYQESLSQQIKIKEQMKEQQKQLEKSIENKSMVVQNPEWFGKPGAGAPMRDPYGNVITTRGKPSNPNYNVHGDWFSFNPQQSNQPPPQTMQTQQSQPQVQPMPYSNEINQYLQDLKTKQEELLQLQLQQLEMERQKRMMEMDLMEQKKKKEMEELEIMKEKAEEEQRMVRDYAEKMKQQQEQYWEEQMDLKRKKKVEKEKKKLEEQRRKLEEERDRILVEQRVIQELPLEITKNVKETVNAELSKLRNSMNFINNNLGEQMIFLKQQLLKAQDRKGKLENELSKVSDELKKTQFIDEIRQREVYNAFVNNKSNEIFQNSQRLIDPDLFNQGKIPPYNIDQSQLAQETNPNIYHTKSQIITPGKDEFFYDTMSKNDLVVDRLNQVNQNKLDRLDEIDNLGKQGNHYYKDTALDDLIRKSETTKHSRSRMGYGDFPM